MQVRRVLVAEDDPLSRNVFVKLLTSAGYEVQGCELGTDAIRIIREAPDVLLVLDHELPDMSGEDVITTLSCSGIKVPFIVVTGQGNERLAADMMKLGAIDYLVKDGVLHDILPEVVRRAFRSIETEEMLHAAEIALRENEERFRHVLYDVNSVAIQGYDPDGTIHFWNPASARLYGYTEEEARGQNIFSLLFPPSSQQTLIDATRAMAESGVAMPVDEYSLRRKDGEVVHVCRSHVVIHPQARNSELFALDTDLTAWREAEQEREHLRMQLYQAQKHESVGRLAGGIAHEFNNLLGAIFGHVELGSKLLDADSPVLENFAEIQFAAQRSADLTKQLLAYARKQIVMPKILQIDDVLEGAVGMLIRLLGEQTCVEWKPGAFSGNVKMDPAQMRQILTQICIFAQDSIGNDYGHIQITTAVVDLETPIENRYEEIPAGPYVRLDVFFSGAALSGESLDQVFEPFYGKEPGSGESGLGLATVYGMLRQNGCYVNILSLRPSENTFSIYFPRFLDSGDSALKEQAPVAKEISAAHVQDKRILLVEDEGAILRLGKMALERAGFEVIAADSPQSALDHISQSKAPLDLLITDVIMPDMNGKELADRVRTHCPGVSVLYMSGYTADVVAHHGILETEVKFLEKPFTMKTLVQAARKAVFVLDDQSSPA